MVEIILAGASRCDLQETTSQRWIVPYNCLPDPLESLVLWKEVLDIQEPFIGTQIHIVEIIPLAASCATFWETSSQRRIVPRDSYGSPFDGTSSVCLVVALLCEVETWKHLCFFCVTCLWGLLFGVA